MSFVRDSLGILAQWPGLLALGMIVQIILARWLGPAGRGAYALALLWSNTLAVICSLGFEQANVYHVASGRHSVKQAMSNSLCGAILAWQRSAHRWMIAVSCLLCIAQRFVTAFHTCPRYRGVILLALIVRRS